MRDFKPHVARLEDLFRQYLEMRDAKNCPCETCEWVDEAIESASNHAFLLLTALTGSAAAAGAGQLEILLDWKAKAQEHLIALGELGGILEHSAYRIRANDIIRHAEAAPDAKS